MGLPVSTESKPAQGGHLASTLAPVIAPMIAGLVALAFQMLFFDRWISMMDEGHILQYADIIGRGGELYRDATAYPLPGAFYFLAFVFKFVEPSVMVSRWIVSIEFATLVALCFVVLRRLTSSPWAWAGVVLLMAYRLWSFPHWHIYSYSTTALFVFFVCFIVLLRFFESSNARYLVVAGLIYGIGVSFKQDYGAAALVAFVGLLVVYARSRNAGEDAKSAEAIGTAAIFVRFFGAAAVVGGAIGLYFYSQGVLDDLIQFTVLNHFVGMSSFEYRSFPDLLPIFVQDPVLRTNEGLASFMPAIIMTTDWQAFNDTWLFQKTGFWDTLMKGYYYAPFALLAYGGVRLIRRRPRLAQAATRLEYLTETGLFALATVWFIWIHTYKPQDYVHLAAVYWPLICLSLIYVHSYVSRTGRSWPVVVLSVPLLISLAYTARVTVMLRDLHDTEIPLARAGGIKATPGQAGTFSSLVDHITAHSEANEPVPVLPYSPGLSFLAGRDGPHRTSYILWPFPEVPRRDEQVVEAIEALRSEMIVYDFVYFLDFPRVRDFAPVLFEYLVDHYEMDRVFSSSELWPKKFATAVRRPEPRDGVSIFAGAMNGADLLIRSQDGPTEPISPSRWDDYIRHDLWPFRRVIALRPSAGGRRTVFTVPVDVPPDAKLATSIGVNPALWDKIPSSWVEFTVAVIDGETREVLHSQTLDTTSDPTHRRWFDLDLPLVKFAGRQVVLEFSTACERERAEHLFMGGWGEPRIVTRGEIETETR
jgi:hypothetical protein